MADETTAMVLVPREPNYAMLRAVENEFAVRIDDPSATAVSLSREETRGIWAIMLAASPAVCDPAQVGGSVGPAAGFSLFLDPKAAGMLSDFIGDVDDDREASAIVLSIGEVEGDGNEPAEYGLRVTMADYPEEGSIVLVDLPAPNPPAPEPCPHSAEPRGCYRVRCQLSRKCASQDQPPQADQVRDLAFEQAAAICDSRELRADTKPAQACYRLAARDIRALKSGVNQQLTTEAPRAEPSDERPDESVIESIIAEHAHHDIERGTAEMDRHQMSAAAREILRRFGGRS